VGLIPRDEGFFTLFNQQAAMMKKAAELLQKMFAAPEQLEQFVNEIKAVEHEADAIVRDVGMRLDRSFITPLDREDIHRLTSELDTVIDLIDGTARRAKMFRIRDTRPYAVGMAEILHRAVDELEESVKQVKDRKSVTKHTMAIKKCEEEGDAMYAEAIGALFIDQIDPIDVIKWKDVYDTLEDALDRCQTASIVLESISLKNS
jgi:predicted phosphate transport protein (TIGR00153 family)